MPVRVLKKTRLGWIVAGDIFQGHSRSAKTICYLTMNPIRSDSDELTRFWEIEQVPNKQFLSKEEQACESHFSENVQRNDNGRYVVKLPFNENKANLGNSFKFAQRRFHALENKFARNPCLKKSYSEFLTEYKDFGHMSLDQDPNSCEKGFFLPHHAVVKEDSLSTKIRVVFDGSAKGSNGISLNDALMVGPTIQEDLFSIYTRFRSFTFAMTADIEKMYRQIEIAPEDSVYQKILWRENMNEPIEIFKLNTVTYGTSSAPFLATRVLKQLALDERDSHPLATQVLSRDFYVDDALTGAANFQDALELRDDLIQITRKAGLTLRKWASNDSRLSRDFSQKAGSDLMSLDIDSTVKTLGLSWNSQDDAIIYTVIKNIDCRDKITKRTILSEIAKLFDPLGLLGLVIVQAKLVIQLLWKLQLSWEELIPLDIRTSWIDFRDQLPLLNNLRFKRCTVVPNALEMQIHGFCDASEKAYGACIYLRTTDKEGRHYTSLVCSKSRVAPVHPITLPRLELCAALLLARLYVATQRALKHIKFSKVFFWSDSTIALHWTLTPPPKLKTFVSNRVAEIQESTNPHEWKHVPTQDNPADLSSRGFMPKEFLIDHIWQHGPHWLSKDEGSWPKMAIQPAEIPEIRKSPPSQISVTLASFRADLLERFSSMRKIIRVIAYCFRFAHNTKSINAEKLSGNLSSAEKDAALNCILKLTQTTAFSKEIETLSKNQEIDRKSKIMSLNPFLDQGILKVGGRLAHSDLIYEQKHPILLPRNSNITDMIIREQHVASKHAGTQATLYSVRERYWPLDGRNTVRKVIRQCAKCSHLQPRNFNYIMGNLPADRLVCSRPFQNVGIDYCGPFYIKEKRFRNTKKLKSYVAVYICFTTKAVHIELVSDLTTDAFIASLKRLFARRGKASMISSDNATNFVGASRELKELQGLINSASHKEKVNKYFEDNEVIWKLKSKPFRILALLPQCPLTQTISAP